MQERNERNEIVRTEMVGETIPPKLDARNTQVVGRIPKKGMTIFVNELEYDILSSDFVRGTFVAKLSRPK